MSAAGIQDRSVATAADLPAGARRPLRDLLLALADSKRVLGIRYADAMLGSPSLETGIAAASMAQDEWGHGRLTYSLLADFGDEPRWLEHERDGGAYHSMELLDEPLPSYPATVAAALVIDGALRLQYSALAGSRYAPIRNRVQKLLDEEVLHEQFATGWVQRLGQSRLSDEIAAALAWMIPGALRWFGPPAGPGEAEMVAERVVSLGSDGLRASLLASIGPVLEQAGLADRLGLRETDDGWQYEQGVEWNGWDASRRRSTFRGPDPETMTRVRGDRNRLMLLE